MNAPTGPMSSEAARTLAKIGAEKRRRRVRAVCDALRASQPPRTTVPLTDVEAQNIAQFYLCMVELERAGKECDLLARLVDPREVAVSDNALRLNAARRELIAAANAIGIDIMTVAGRMFV